jgi:hypothetical protein
VRVEGEKRASLVPEHAFAVDPGGIFVEDAEGGFDFGAAVAAVHAQGHRQGPGQRVEAAIGALGQQLQQLAQFVAPGGCLPEQAEGLGQVPPALAGAEQLGGGAQAIGIVEVEQAGADGAAERLLLGMGAPGSQPSSRRRLVKPAPQGHRGLFIEASR